MEATIALTMPTLADAKGFFDVINDSEIHREFPHFRSILSFEHAFSYLNGMIQMNNQETINFFKLIRISNGEYSHYDDSNSRIVGFISNHKTELMDMKLAGGFNDMLSFGVKNEYRGMGIMSAALNTMVDGLYHDGFNLIPCLAKPSNLASEKVLLKCGFVMVNKNPLGNLFVRRLNMDKNQFYSIFGING